MSHSFDEQNEVEILKKQAENSLLNDQNYFAQSKIQIQVTTKKKKQIINLESSSEKKPSPSPSPDKPPVAVLSKEPRKVKPKKVQHKCQLCKGSGKKVQMKKCTNCKYYTHLHCLDENQGKGKFVCDKCKSANLQDENKAFKKGKKQQQKIEVAKAAQKKLDKEKKKDQSNRVLQKFKEKYPFYIGDGEKIKFPIEDKLLYIYREYFDCSEARVMPVDHPLIPSKYLGDLLQIENFIASFGREFQQDFSGDFRKSVLYIQLNCEGPDKTFQKILGAIIKIYLKDIFEKNKTENVKILNDNSFFILLGTINQAQEMSAQFVALTSREIIRNLSSIPSMRNSFKDFVYPETFNLETKIFTLIQLIQGLSQVDGFHDMVSRKSEKISELTKDKADFVTKLKKNEAEALSNKEKLKEILGRGNKNEAKVQVVEEMFVERDKNAQKQAERTKKKTQKLASDGEVSQRIIRQYKNRIVDITKRIPFVISEVLFLGSDKNQSQYYFYLGEPNRIYVRYRNYILDQQGEFKVYQSKEKIIEFLKSLNTKGVHEKRLYEAINNLIKEQIIRNLTLEEEQKEITINQRGQMLEECYFLESDQKFREKVVEDIMEIEDKFSTYLAIKNYRWTSESKREEFKFGFPYIEDFSALKEQIKNLQQSFLFVEIVRERQILVRQQSDSNEEIEKEINNFVCEKQSTKRKKPIRIWGINSERVKKFWIEYLETCINYTGVWISVNIFKNYVDKYIQKKMQYIREQERKETEQKQKQIKEKRMKQQREREKQQRNLDRLRSRQKPKLIKKKQSSHSVVEDQSQQPNSRRKLRASNRAKNRPLTIDSDDQQAEAQPGNEQESQNEDQCHVCKDAGEVICCDTCPKVFHLSCLGLKQTPDGQWSCIDCLYKINNERQTRSRTKKMKN